MSLLDHLKTEMPRIQTGHDLASLYHFCGLVQYLAVMRASLAGQQRQQGEYAGIACGTKRQGSERMRAPAERADNVPESRHRVERNIEHSSTHGVIDEIKALPRRTRGNIFVDRHFPVD